MAATGSTDRGARHEQDPHGVTLVVVVRRSYNDAVKALVTGAAGFVGSTLADSLLGDGWGVRGVDSFSSYYDPELKRANLSSASRDQRFELVVADLVSADLDDLLDGIDVVFHQAGQPGVRMSWADDFRVYADANIVATQRLQIGRAHV